MSPVRIGSALFNADHTRLGEELRRVASAGLDFFHLDVFDGYLVDDLGFAPRTIQALRPLTRLPFEVHLAAREALRFVPALAKAGANLVFLPAESTPMLYEAIHALREHKLGAGLCLALGTPLSVLEPVLPMLDAVLLLGRVTGEGSRGRTFNTLLLDRVRAARRMIDALGAPIDLQAAGGLEAAHCVAAAEAGATSLPLGAALHREPDAGAFVGRLRALLEPPAPAPKPPAITAAAPARADWRVLAASRSFGPHCTEAVARMHAAGCTLIPNQWGRAPTEDELLAVIGQVDAVVSGTEPLTARVIAAAPRLKVIAKHGVGYENIDLEAARARGIPVALAAGAISDSVADMAMALLLALARHIPQSARAVRDGGWPKPVGVELKDRTLGIIGLGAIGKAVCRRAKGFGMRVLAHDPYPDESFAQSWAVRYVALDELLAQSDAVTLHALVTDQTRRMINADTLARMKRGALLINTGRGELVDEAALAAALRAGTIAGAASDVFVKEPPGAHELLGLENFIGTPHSAGMTVEGLRRMGEITADNVLRCMRGEEPVGRVA